MSMGGGMPMGGPRPGATMNPMAAGAMPRPVGGMAGPGYDPFSTLGRVGGGQAPQNPFNRPGMGGVPPQQQRK